MISIQIQTVLFENTKESILRSLESINNSFKNYLQKNDCYLTISYGDASNIRCFSNEQIDTIKSLYNNINICYQYFGFNSGTSKGHNLLGSSCKSNYILIINPDVIFEANLLENLLKPFKDKNVGIVEAKQIPIEHPKEYNIHTGETDWATGACFIIPYNVWEETNGFDENLFLYCDDVDLSWRVRAKGYKIIYNPHACIFHSKFISNSCKWQPSTAEQYYSIEAYLIMLYKWQHHEELNKLLNKYKNLSGLEKKAYTNFIKKMTTGQLKKFVGNENDLKIACFHSGYFTKHRFW